MLIKSACGWLLNVQELAERDNERITSWKLKTFNAYSQIFTGNHAKADNNPVCKQPHF